MTPLKTRTAHGGEGRRVEAREAFGRSQWVVCLGGPPLWEETPPKRSRAQGGVGRGGVGWACDSGLRARSVRERGAGGVGVRGEVCGGKACGRCRCAADPRGTNTVPHAFRNPLVMIFGSSPDRECYRGCGADGGAVQGAGGRGRGRA